MSKSAYYGITPPISTKGPEKSELQQTDLLRDTLAHYLQYETSEEAHKRQEVMGRLSTIFKDFVRKVSIQNGLPEELANDVGGKIFTFGSYRLGVHGKGNLF